jgi:hypothetical protein
MITENNLPMPDDAPDCLGLGREDQLYDYYNGVLVGEEARVFETHLLDCIACRRKVATLDWINEMLKSEVDASEQDVELASEWDLELTSELDLELTSEWDLELASLAENPQLVIQTTSSGANLPTLYLALGGLGILGALGFGAIKLFKYSR